MPLSPLLRVKYIKLDKAEREARLQMTRLQQAQRALQQGVEAMNDYRDWRLNEEALLYLRHQDSLLDRKALAQWRQQVTTMREKDSTLEQETEDQRRALEQQQERVLQSQQQLLNAQQQAEKFIQLQKEAFALQLQVNENKEAAELEEFRNCTSEST